MVSNVEEIKSKLIDAGLCEKWQKNWQDDYSLDDIVGISLTLEGIEYMHKNRAVILELLPTFEEYVNGKIVTIPNFGRGAMFINTILRTDEVIDADVIYVSGSDTEIRLPEYKVVKIIVDNGSTLRIGLSSNNIVFIELYDESRLTLLRGGNDNAINIVRDTINCAIMSYIGESDKIKINTK